MLLIRWLEKNRPMKQDNPEANSCKYGMIYGKGGITVLWWKDYYIKNSGQIVHHIWRESNHYHTSLYKLYCLWLKPYMWK